MMLNVGFKVEEGYVSEMFQTFGTYAANQNHVVDLDEFEKLWTHLGGAEAVSTPQEAPPPRLPKSPPRLPRLPTGGKSTAA